MNSWHRSHDLIRIADHWKRCTVGMLGNRGIVAERRSSEYHNSEHGSGVCGGTGEEDVVLWMCCRADGGAPLLPQQKPPA